MDTIQQEAEVAFRTVQALRELTVETGTVTLRTQNKILQSLRAEVLAVVALKLKDAKDGKR